MSDNFEGCISYLYLHDEKGRVTSRFCLDAAGNKTVRKSGVYEVRSFYEDSTSTEILSLLDEDGEAFDTATPIISQRRDRYGNIVEVRRFDANRRLTFSTLPIEQYTYDENGYLTRFDELTASGILIYTTECNYDNNGNLLELVERPVGTAWRKSDIARTVSKYDHLNRRLSDRYYDSSDVLSSQATFTYADDGYLTKIVYADSLGQPFEPPTYTAIGYHRDTLGNALRTTYLAASGRPIANYQGYAIVSKTFDDKGQVLEVQYLDANGRRVNPNGKPPATRVYSYNERGRLIRVAGFDANGTPVSVEELVPPKEE